MPKDERKKKVGGLFGLDPTLGIGDKVIDYVEQAQEKEKKRLQKSDYYALCPNCGASVVTEEFLKNGCYRCGYKEKD